MSLRPAPGNDHDNVVIRRQDLEDIWKEVRKVSAKGLGLVNSIKHMREEIERLREMESRLPKTEET